MQQPITSAMSVEERMEGMQDELKLLKSEIRQTLIDLREFMMKGNAFAVSSVLDGQVSFPPIVQEAAAVTPNPAVQNNPTPIQTTTMNTPPVIQQPESNPVADTNPAPVTPAANVAPADPVPAPQNIAAVPFNAPGNPPMAVASSNPPLDAVKMGNIIRWFGTVARRGMSPRQLRPFLEAYEQSGHLTPAMATLTYKSLEELEYAMGGSSNSYSPTEYSQCLLELHEIICNPGYSPANVGPWDSSIHSGNNG